MSLQALQLQENRGTKRRRRKLRAMTHVMTHLVQARRRSKRLPPFLQLLPATSRAMAAVAMPSGDWRQLKAQAEASFHSQAYADAIAGYSEALGALQQEEGGDVWEQSKLLSNRCCADAALDALGVCSCTERPPADQLLSATWTLCAAVAAGAWLTSGWATGGKP